MKKHLFLSILLVAGVGSCTGSQAMTAGQAAIRVIKGLAGACAAKMAFRDFSALKQRLSGAANYLDAPVAFTQRSNEAVSCGIGSRIGAVSVVSAFSIGSKIVVASIPLIEGAVVYYWTIKPVLHGIKSVLRSS